MWNDFSKYIISNYANTRNNYANAGNSYATVPKIVEVGVGSFLKVAFNLREHLKGDVIMTDIKPSHAEVIQDDICLPDLKIYEGASLIYSIRPPEEMHQCLVDIAEKTRSDLIIKPLSTDCINSKTRMKLINYKKAVFYLIQ